MTMSILQTKKLRHKEIKATGCKSHSQKAEEPGLTSQQSGSRVIIACTRPVLGVPTGLPATRFHASSSPLHCGWRVLPEAQT